MRDARTIELLNGFFRGDSDAVDLALMLTRIADVWDDLIDKDVEVAPDDIHQMMWFSLSGINRNQFFRRHSAELLPIIETSIFNWLASNELREKHGQKGTEIAHVIRHSLCDVFVHMCRIIGGYELAVKATPGIKLLAQGDTLEEFLKG